MIKTLFPMVELLKYSVGIDVSKEKFDSCFSVIDSSQKVTVKSTRQMDNSASGIKDLIRVYPNPANSHLVLEFDSDQKSPSEIEVFDMWGRRVLNHRSHLESSLTLDIGHLATGTYFYKVSAGTLIQTGKVIIAR